MKIKSFYLICCLIVVACSNNDYIVPKPKGYFRIALPEKQYVSFDSILPFTFQYPAYSRIVFDSSKKYENFTWFNIVFPSLHGKVHLSYSKLNNDLNLYVDDAHTFAYKHVSKATDIKTEVISIPEKRIYGLYYKIEGSSTASPIQLILTDSTKHFIRGALYFNHPPNNDSIQPIINFIEEDIKKFYTTLEWKN